MQPQHWFRLAFSLPCLIKPTHAKSSLLSCDKQGLKGLWTTIGQTASKLKRGRFSITSKCLKTDYTANKEILWTNQNNAITVQCRRLNTSAYCANALAKLKFPKISFGTATGSMILLWSALITCLVITVKVEAGYWFRKWLQTSIHTTSWSIPRNFGTTKIGHRDRNKQPKGRQTQALCWIQLLSELHIRTLWLDTPTFLLLR